MFMVLSLALSSANAALVAHYEFEGDANDSAGTNHGTVFGAQYTEGKVGQCLNFDGDGDCVRTSYEGTPSEYTIAFWYNLNEDIEPAAFSNRYRALVSRTGDESYHVELWSVWFHSTDGLRLHNEKSLNNYATVNYAPEIFYKEQWHHVVATGNTTQGKIYFDGELKSTTNDNFVTGAWDDSVPFNIARPYAGKANRFFNGKIDDVRIYDHALTEEEIFALLGERVEVDIKPGSCPNPVNVKSIGVLPVAILGTEDFDVNAIDPASIELAGVGAIRSSYGDVASPVLDANDCNCIETGPDGYLDLTLKFKTQEIVSAIGEVNKGDVLTLQLTGVLFDESHIEGTDCVVIVGRFKPFNKADFNRDKKVDMADFAEFAENWMESTED